MNRRTFLTSSAAWSATVSVHALPAATGKPALLGGEPARRSAPASWPVFGDSEERALLGVLRSGKWYRGNGRMVARFEEAYARLTGAKHCLAVANGTSALLTALSALGVGPGDEVILPPYTFVATLNVVLEKFALPVFVDSNRETFQMDARKLEAKITPRTRAILVVHMAGGAADLDTILAVARKHQIPVIEDACQAHLAEWRNRKVGTWATAGCFSFQASKNLNSGEGGAILTGNTELFHKCSAFHSNGRNWHAPAEGYQHTGLNLRMTEFQAALLISQMERLEQQSRLRESNAAYLNFLFNQIPGIRPARLHDGCSRHAWHLYMFRYEKNHFHGLPRAQFLKALNAEGIPASAGYRPLNKEPLIASALRSPGYQRLFSEAERKSWSERNQCPENDLLCEEAVWLTQNLLLGSREEMEAIAAAIVKIQRHAKELV
ncbi:MAG: DegT/DnrJ/EryC1/StrS family aminotransferase [Bryobacteraceae bacterium]|nr:DegT/DnrJ/EryC1/StrS family aminotransferase [Bryobacteraceae bacterium]MDW8378358.1 DegT/DnrJ/EryC1/StrS family aminotransferase [Bryobacterales bacterium]